MFIKAKRYFITGNGSLDYHITYINKSEISNIYECGYESRPYTGLNLVLMKNGDRFYSDLKIQDII